MAPEYAMRGQFSVRSDVYSYGVLVLEIVTGRKRNSFHDYEHYDDLLSYVRVLRLFNLYNQCMYSWLSI